MKLNDYERMVEEIYSKAEEEFGEFYYDNQEFYKARDLKLEATGVTRNEYETVKSNARATARELLIKKGIEDSSENINKLVKLLDLDI